ncbi:2235_t:CDS:1, partial [Cetraspora pellucida]
GHDRRSCPNRFAYNPFNPFAPQNSMMFQGKNMMKVPWQTYTIISRRPEKGRTCSYCGGMGHTNRICFLRGFNQNVANVNNIKKSLSEYFKNPEKKSLRLCGCCGEVGHSRRYCRHAPLNCIPLHQLNIIKTGLKLLKKEYNLQGHIVPQYMFPKIKKEFY